MSNGINTLILFNRKSYFGDVEEFVNDYIDGREITLKRQNPTFQVELEDGECIRILPYTEEYFLRSIRGCTINKIVFMEDFSMAAVREIMREIGYIYYSRPLEQQYGIFMGDVELLLEPETEEEEE